MTILNENGLQLVEKEKEYIAYIEEHVNNVMTAFQSINTKLTNYPNYPIEDAEISFSLTRETVMENLRIVAERVHLHDQSKYSDEEFAAYRRKFHPTTEESTSGEDAEALAIENFNKAWEHHYKNNPHHPGYWTDKEMTLDAIIEMLADWVAMSIKFHSSTRDFWENKAGKERSLMSPRVIKIVDELLDIIL